MDLDEQLSGRGRWYIDRFDDVLPQGRRDEEDLGLLLLSRHGW